MLGCSLINLLARRTTDIYVQSNPLLYSLYFQKSPFCHSFNCVSIMEDRKRRIDIGPKKHKIVTQTWRPVSTQPSSYEGDSERGKLHSRSEQMRHVISSTVLAPDKLVPTTVGSKHDISIDQKLVPPEKHSILMEVGWLLMRFIKGKRGGTQEEIERETGVKILFPSSKTEDFIVIEGNSAESVSKASEKIKIIIDKAVNSPDLDYSHFVSIPLAIHPGLVEKLVNFQNTILGIAASDKDKIDGGTSHEADKDDAHVKVNIKSDDQRSNEAHIVTGQKAECASYKVNITNIPIVSYPPKEPKVPASETTSSKRKESGIEKSIFIKPQTFHLTVLMLKLWNKDRVKAAAKVLRGVSSKVTDALENKPISIRLNGLDCMKGSLEKARVLYAPVEEIGDEGRLLRACQIITDAYVEAGLVIEKDVQQKLKLHATVMNARHQTWKKGTRKLEWFDARGIFELYGSEEWGEYHIREAHLSQRFAFDENGYYRCCASFTFPNEMHVD